MFSLRSRVGALHGLPSGCRPVFRNLQRSRGVSIRRRSRTSLAPPTCSVRQNKGTLLNEDAVTVLSPMGEGSFGQVFQGSLELPSGQEEAVILKRVKDRVIGAQEMAEMEHLLNVYASTACRRSVAPFVGYIEVQQPRGRLTKGLWLAWKYEGDKTLAYYLRRRDAIAALAADLDVPEAAVVPTVMQQLFTCLADLHAAGLVHRDVKPANVVFSEDERRFKLIDLGAAADLRTGTNYKPSETILDPVYCPPEEYILPTDAPALAQKASPLALAMSPLLWSQHRPDAFDAWSSGVVLLQLALPFMRTNTAVRNWKNTYARYGYDLQEWRLRAALTAKATAALDADDGSGWDLAAALLRPRDVETDGRGSVRFVNTGAAPRLTAAAALRHPFVKKAAGRRAAAGGPLGLGQLFGSGDGGSLDVDKEEEGSQERGTGKGRGTGAGSSGRSAASSSSGSRPSSSKGVSRGAAILDGADASGGSSKLGMWAQVKSRLFDLEARIATQESDTRTQTAIVQQLQADVAAGKAGQEELASQEKQLAGMKAGLQASVREFSSVYKGATGFISGMLGGRAGSASSAAAAEAEAAAAAAAAAEQEAAASAVAAAEALAALDAEARPESGVGASVAGAATSMIYQGLKFTGRAVAAVADMASSVEQSISRAQAEANEQKAASAAYVAALAALSPAIQTTTTWDDVAASMPEDDAFAALTERQRRQVFASYVDALTRAQRAAAKRALVAFAALVEEAAPEEGYPYPDFAARCARDPRLQAVTLEADRVTAYQAYMSRRRAEREAASAKAEREAARSQREAARAQAEAEKVQRVAAAEAAFRQLMQEQQAVVAGGATWPQVKQALWSDARWEAVPEGRRKALHAEFCALLLEAGGAAAPAAANKERPAPPQRDVPSPQKVQQEPAKADQLAYLREEQARLKSEYERMEAKLREMESALKVQDLVGALLEDGTSVEADSDGNVVFKFATDPLPSAKRAAGTAAGRGSGPSHR